MSGKVPNGSSGAHGKFIKRLIIAIVLIWIFHVGLSVLGFNITLVLPLSIAFIGCIGILAQRLDNRE
jgi:hypothetical protein